MKIDITEKEYGILLDILYISDWVLHSHKIGMPDETEGYRNLMQRLYSYAKDLGYENLIEYSAHHEEFVPTREYEEKNDSMELIEEFENDTFWNELIERLVRRDLIRQEGKDKLLNMGVKEILEKEEPFRKMYSAEFEKNGLEYINIRHVKRPNGWVKSLLRIFNNL